MKRLAIVLLVLVVLALLEPMLHRTSLPAPFQRGLIAVLHAQSAPVSSSQMALAGNTAFRMRCAYTLAQIAMTVRAESSGTLYHAERDALARYVIADPQAYADKIAPVVVGLTNVVAAGTTVAGDGTVTSNVTDAALLSQLTSVWNILAGV